MKYHCTIELLFDWFGLVFFANKNKNCQLSYSWFQTSQTGGQWYNDTPPFSIPWFYSTHNCILWKFFGHFYHLLRSVSTWDLKSPETQFDAILYLTVDIFVAIFSLWRYRRQDSNPQPWDDEASVLPLFNHYYTTALPLFYHCSTTVLPLFYHCSTTVLPLLYHCSTTVLPLFYHCCTTVLPLFYHCCTTVLPLFYHCSTTALPLFYHCAVTSITRHKYKELKTYK